MDSGLLCAADDQKKDLRHTSSLKRHSFAQKRPFHRICFVCSDRLHDAHLCVGGDLRLCGSCMRRRAIGTQPDANEPCWVPATYRQRIRSVLAKPQMGQRLRKLT
jgi:hypothetical protein